MRNPAMYWARCARLSILLALACMALAAPAGGQKNKNKKKDQQTDDSQAAQITIPPASDSQGIDQTIGEALGYWQIGDIESLHKYYADDVVMVSGIWEPPVMGWNNYVNAYKLRRAQLTSERLDRSNTLIKVDGNFAWATYQFDYSAMKDSEVARFRGHTTLILAKRADRWVITLDHSSIVDSSVPATAASAAAAPSAKP